jgi:hypothetical protein
LTTFKQLRFPSFDVLCFFLTRVFHGYLTTPYTPKKNEIGKKEKKTFVESVGCMIHGHSIPMKFLGQVV